MTNGRGPMVLCLSFQLLSCCLKQSALKSYYLQLTSESGPSDSSEDWADLLGTLKRVQSIRAARDFSAHIINQSRYFSCGRAQVKQKTCNLSCHTTCTFSFVTAFVPRQQYWDMFGKANQWSVSARICCLLAILLTALILFLYSSFCGAPGVSNRVSFAQL